MRKKQKLNFAKVVPESFHYLNLKQIVIIQMRLNIVENVGEKIKKLITKGREGLREKRI